MRANPQHNRVKEVTWIPPNPGWIKINFGGASKGNLNLPRTIGEGLEMKHLGVGGKMLSIRD